LRGDDFRNFVTLSKRVTLIACWALADSNVVSWSTVSVESTGTTARVQAVLFDTGLNLGAFIIDNALWPAIGR